MLRLICVVIIQNCSMHLSILNSLQSSVVNNNINWSIPWAVCSQRDLCFWTADWLRWEDSCGDLPVQPSCLKHENLEQVLWDHVIRFWISLRMKPVALGSFLACLSNLTVRKNIFFFFLNFWMMVWILILSGCLFLKVLNGNSCISSFSLGHTVKTVYLPYTFPSNICIFL